MNRIYILSFFLLIGIGINAQTVPSSCNGPDSLKASYNFDATKLAIRNLYMNKHADTSEILIAQQHKEQILNALIAVYQAYDLPARDEVVDFFNVHALGGPVTNSFKLYADTTFEWVKNWEAGIKLSGIEEVDLWVDSFDLKFTSTPSFEFVDLLGDVYLEIHFETQEPLNLKPLMEEFSLVEGIVYVKEDDFSFEIEKDIIYTDFSANGYTQLAYRYAWDDCQNACLNEHIWTFRVYHNDCSVAFSGDSGDALPVEEVNQISRLALFPNPTSDKISLNLVGPQRKDITVYLFDAYGQMLTSEKVDFHNGLINLDFSLAALPVGVYFITLENDNQVLTERVLKK